MFLILRGQMKKAILRVSITILFGITLVLFGPCVYSRYLNNYRLSQFENGLSQVNHPQGSKLLARRSAVGLLIGNSNHCDYFVGEIRSCDLPREQIQKYYADLSIINPINGNLLSLNILFVGTNGFPDDAILPYGYEDLADWGLEIHNETGTIYLLSTFFTWIANSDMRCH